MTDALAALQTVVSGIRDDPSYAVLVVTPPSLVRRIAELHGGTAHEASDGHGRGSVFTVELRLPQGP